MASSGFIACLISMIYPFLYYGLYFINNPGSHMLKEGSRVINTRVTAFATRKGRAPLKIFPMPSFDMAEATFRHIPTGGVTRPTANPQIRITPNCTPDIPSARTAGRKTGVRSSIAGLTSIKL